jgi:hypothetical protein
MSMIFERNLKPDTGTTLRKVLQLGLEPYMERFEQVSAGASKVRLSYKKRFNEKICVFFN